MESSHFSDEKTILFEDSLQEWREEGRVHQAASLPVAQHSSKGEPTCSMGHTEGNHSQFAFVLTILSL